MLASPSELRPAGIDTAQGAGDLYDKPRPLISSPRGNEETSGWVAAETNDERPGRARLCEDGGRPHMAVT